MTGIVQSNSVSPDTRVAVAIVGAGQAGVECGSALRVAGFPGAIEIFGAEAERPYQRPPLTKALLQGKTDPERFRLKADDAYASQSIVLSVADSVAELDVHTRRLRTASGRLVGFDICVLATGARARPFPGMSGPGIFSIRTISDALALRRALRQGQRLVVIGGGYLGLEAAATASSLGLDVVVLEQASGILGERLSGAMTEALARMHADAGVRLRCGVQIVGAERSGSGWRICLSDGDTCDADAVLVAIGATPEVGLAEAAGLRCEGGIVVDARCATSAEGFYAIGDCSIARRPPFADRPLRIESVNNALVQARAAAAAIAGIAPPSPRAPTFWSEQFARRLQIAGLANINAIERDVLTRTARGLIVERYVEGRLAVVEALDSPAEFVKASQRVNSAESPVAL